MPNSSQLVAAAVGAVFVLTAACSSENYDPPEGSLFTTAGSEGGSAEVCVPIFDGDTRGTIGWDLIENPTNRAIEMLGIEDAEGDGAQVADWAIVPVGSPNAWVGSGWKEPTDSLPSVPPGERVVLVLAIELKELADRGIIEPIRMRYMENGKEKSLSTYTTLKSARNDCPELYNWD